MLFDHFAVHITVIISTVVCFNPFNNLIVYFIFFIDKRWIWFLHFCCFIYNDFYCAFPLNGEANKIFGFLVGKPKRGAIFKEVGQGQPPMDETMVQR